MKSKDFENFQFIEDWEEVDEDSVSETETIIIIDSVPSYSSTTISYSGDCWGSGSGATGTSGISEKSSKKEYGGFRFYDKTLSDRIRKSGHKMIKKYYNYKR